MFMGFKTLRGGGGINFKVYLMFRVGWVWRPNLVFIQFRL